MKIVYGHSIDEDTDNENNKEINKKFPSSVKINDAKQTHDGTTSSITSAIGMNSTTYQNQFLVFNNAAKINQWDMVLKQFIKDNFFKHVSWIHSYFMINMPVNLYVISNHNSNAR